MARYRSYGLEFKRQVVESYLAGEATLHGLARQHEISRNLIRLWVAKYEAGEFDEERISADVLARYEERVAELERKVGQLTMENDLLKKASRSLRPPSAVKPSIVSGPRGLASDEDVN